MNSFSPKTYQIYQYDDTNLSQISYYYNCFTLLEKPTERNVYKVSLAQMLHYMFDFGIGYNSKCVTILTTQQQFILGRYVNRHATESDKRPATVADLKKKILDVVEEMIRRTVKYDNKLIKKTNTIFPKYLFSLDKKLDSIKLKQITGHDYIEITDFENFAYASSDPSYNMPKYQNGYVPISAVRCVPNHNHKPHSKINDTIHYSWEIGLQPQGHSSWAPDKVKNISISLAGGWDDKNIGTFKASDHGEWPDNTTYISVVATMNCSWDKPTGVSCFENEEKDPVNTKNGKLSIRYYGRRYRLFKRQD